MLRIKNTAWHYRYWKFLHESDFAKPRNLCRYFWFLFFAITIPATVISAAIIGVIALAIVIYGHPLQSGLIVTGILSAIACGVGLFFAIRGAALWNIDRRANKRVWMSAQPPAPPKEPSIIWSFIKAKKAKACPLIEVYDPKASK